MTNWRIAHEYSNAWLISGITVVLAGLLGFIAPSFPLLPLLLTAAVGFLILAGIGSKSESLFLLSLGGLLVGYIVQGKAFAYIGIPPLYIGEIVLVVGIMAYLFSKSRSKLSSLELLLVAFMFWGAARTLPYLTPHGLSAVRDAALWYYAVYAVLVSLLLTRERINASIAFIAKILPLLIIWLSVMPIVFRPFQHVLPHFPGSPVPMPYIMKANDRGIVLVGLAVFMLTGLYRQGIHRRVLPSLLLWPLWLVATLIAIVESRGAMLAIAVPLMLVMLLKPSKEWLRMGLIALSAVVLIFIADPVIDLGGDRKVSVDQIVANFTSVISEETANLGGVQGTKDWRLEWWTAIYDDTVHGPYFWGGQGFGINLANEYGFQTDREDDSLRSPHNSHITVLARMGVPGAILWALLQAGFLFQMIRAYRWTRTSGQVYWSNVFLLLLTIWLAVIIAASFDVYLEGPQGAIPFWCVFGAGLAAMRIQPSAAIYGHTSDAVISKSRSLDAHPSRA